MLGRFIIVDFLGFSKILGMSLSNLQQRLQFYNYTILSPLEGQTN